MKNKTKQKNEKEFIKIPLPTKRIKEIFKILLLSLAFAIMIILVVEIIIPITLTTGNTLLSLTNLWILNQNDIYILFFGGIFFALISWKILLIIINAWIKIVNFLIEKYKKI